ncbi:MULTISPECIES: hypothetical protein [Clostridium]|jgi:hypothetical protein|uniref:Uncharacterized protein n=2 Tax=Clostridium beijerinckii TaxID=1520 RepID=A0A1S8NTA1_CLOBE|nr:MULTISPECIES: hypothetical protein [Clostridium]ABR34448.1 hypothetical protein Cbei_2288 [Clostridium beijerinckii NCIMB 8052]AIU04967.1 hypothetical protein Cbs_2288 [Clostridium beijerinckii ATCC 35702]MCI1581575.1 hypothetical protein [Clostridium beijerinckii]MCI1586163.1 hypothetical protein [Clostridium beijerinckii]MCI1625149.1 hypothetical protein [Clostridium beijerinckii]
MTGFENLTPEDSLILTNAIVISLAKGKNAEELNVLGNFIVGIGCLLVITIMVTKITAIITT